MEQLYRKSSLHLRHARVVNDHRIFHVRFHLPQQPGCCRVERSKVTPEYETPLGPGHAFRLNVHVNVSTERWVVFPIAFVSTRLGNPGGLSPPAPAGCGPTDGLSGLSSSCSKTFRNQLFLRLSKKVFQRNQPCFHGKTQTNTGSATIRDEMDT